MPHRMFTAEEQAFREEVVDVVGRETAPRAGEIDRDDDVPSEVFRVLD